MEFLSEEAFQKVVSCLYPVDIDGKTDERCWWTGFSRVDSNFRQIALANRKQLNWRHFTKWRTHFQLRLGMGGAPHATHVDVSSSSLNDWLILYFITKFNPDAKYVHIGLCLGALSGQDVLEMCKRLKSLEELHMPEKLLNEDQEKEAKEIRSCLKKIEYHQMNNDNSIMDLAYTTYGVPHIKKWLEDDKPIGLRIQAAQALLRHVLVLRHNHSLGPLQDICNIILKEEEDTRVKIPLLALLAAQDPEKAVIPNVEAMSLVLHSFLAKRIGEAGAEYQYNDGVRYAVVKLMFALRSDADVFKNSVCGWLVEQAKDDEYDFVRAAVFNGLSNVTEVDVLRATGAFEAVADALLDYSSVVRAAALRAACKEPFHASPEIQAAVPEIVELLSDGHYAVRLHAARVAKTLDPKELVQAGGLPPLEALFEEDYTDDKFRGIDLRLAGMGAIINICKHPDADTFVYPKKEGSPLYRIVSNAPGGNEGPAMDNFIEMLREFYRVPSFNAADMTKAVLDRLNVSPEFPAPKPVPQPATPADGEGDGAMRDRD